MYTFDHPNVLKLSGVCMDGGPAPYIIMPFMANGSLKEYLLKERENLLLDPNSTEPDYAVNTIMMAKNVGTPFSMSYLGEILQFPVGERAKCILDFPT